MTIRQGFSAVTKAFMTIIDRWLVVILSTVMTPSNISVDKTHTKHLKSAVKKETCQDIYGNHDTTPGFLQWIKGSIWQSIKWDIHY